MRLYLKNSKELDKLNIVKHLSRLGYTTKKRGWGLGLSLSKRIIEQYHKGEIRVLKSEIGKGSTMQISLKKITDS